MKGSIYPQYRVRAVLHDWHDFLLLRSPGDRPLKPDDGEGEGVFHCFPLNLGAWSWAVFTASQSKAPACEKEQLGRAVLLPAEALFWRFEVGDQAARLRRVSKRPGHGLGKDAFKISSVGLLFTQALAACLFPCCCDVVYVYLNDRWVLYHPTQDLGV